MSTPKKPEYRHIGKYRPRKDAREIVTGKCIYLDDFRMKDMLHAKLMPSPYAHAMIKDIDASKAEALPGVYAVVTYKNQPEFSKEFLQGLPPVKKVCDQHLRYVGDCVALVAAETEELCEEAIRLIKVDYEVLPAVFDIEQAKADGAAQLYPGFFENNRYEKDLGFGDEKMLFAVERGDCDKACEEADYVYEGTGYFETNPSPLAPEPPEMIMYYDDINNKYLMWATAQSDRVPKMPPDVGRMPADTVIESRVFNVGGSYGNKQEMTLMCLYTALLSRLTGHPVRFRMNKEDQLTIHEMRLGSRFTARFSIKDGIMTSVKGHWYVMPGYTDDAGYCITAVGLGEMQVALAKCQNWDIDTCMYATNTISCGTVRGFGGQELKSAMMPVIDHMLADMNIDPVQFFHDNFVHAGDRYMWRDCNWWTCHEVDYRQAILEAAEKFGWKEKFKGWYKPTAVNGSKRIGVGVSIHGNGDVGEDNSEAIVRLHTNGSVILNQSLVESGQGQRAACAKMVAEVLNVPFESVTVTNTGTVDNPVEFGLCGSRGTLTSGTAATRAAEDALRQLQAMAAAVFRCSPTEIETCDGFVWVSNKPENKLPWAAIIPYSTSITGFGRWKANYAQPNMCINFVEMEVDVETGEAKLLRELIGTDVGQIIDPKACEMQLQASIGSAMVDTGTFEETIYDYYTGRIMTNNLIDYKWRPFNEFPPIDLVIKESQPNISRFKAVGVGEISGSAGAAAIAMAIGNAIGKPYMKYPATPVNVLQALKEG